MSTQDPTPAPPSPAEVCERLKQLRQSIENGDYDTTGCPPSELAPDVATLTAALLLIEQGEKERERFGMNIDQLASHAMHLENNVIADLRHQRAAATARVKQLEAEKLDEIENAARQACHTGTRKEDYMGRKAGTVETDSGALSTNAGNLRTLAEAGRFRIVAEFGRMVVGYWPENDPEQSARAQPSPESK